MSKALDIKEIRAGYGAICMRASQVGVHSDAGEIEAAARTIASAHLAVSMVTGGPPQA